MIRLLSYQNNACVLSFESRWGYFYTLHIPWINTGTSGRYLLPCSGLPDYSTTIARNRTVFRAQLPLDHFFRKGPVNALNSQFSYWFGKSIALTFCQSTITITLYYCVLIHSLKAVRLVPELHPVWSCFGIMLPHIPKASPNSLRLSRSDYPSWCLGAGTFNFSTGSDGDVISSSNGYSAATTGDEPKISWMVFSKAYVSNNATHSDVRGRNDGGVRFTTIRFRLNRETVFDNTGTFLPPS